MKKRYYCEIVPVTGNTDVSIAHAVAELAAFRKLHPPPAPLPPKPTRNKRNSDRVTHKGK